MYRARRILRNSELITKIMFDSPFNLVVKKMLHSLLKSQPPYHVILDLGARDAPYSRFLRNKLVVAVDLPQRDDMGFSNSSLGIIQQFGINGIFASGEALPLRSSVIDLVICTEVLEHIERDDLAIREINRVLRNSGCLFLTTPNGAVIPLERGRRDHHRHYTPNELKRKHEVVGYSIKVLRSWHKPGYFRLVNKFRPKSPQMVLPILPIWFISGLLTYLVFVLGNTFLSGDYNLLVIAFKKQQVTQ